MHQINVSLTDSDYQMLTTLASKVGTSPTTMARGLILAELGGINPTVLSKMDRRATALSISILERLLGLSARQNGMTGEDARIAAQSAAAQIVQEIESKLEAEHD
uniref:Uncharacterized protein n=1 Tax=mine drainage metagenome TaxID=410659 RepID=E6Q8X9_9ZZZZ